MMDLPDDGLGQPESDAAPPVPSDHHHHAPAAHPGMITAGDHGTTSYPPSKCFSPQVRFRIKIGNCALSPPLREANNQKEKEEEKKKDASGGDEDRPQEKPESDAVLELTTAAADNRKRNRSPSHPPEQAPDRRPVGNNNSYNNDKGNKDVNKTTRTEFWMALTKQEVESDMAAMKKASARRPLPLLNKVRCPRNRKSSRRR